MARKPKEDPRYYTIEEGIPIPPRNYSNDRAIHRVAFEEMRVGDSFLIPPNADAIGFKRRLFKYTKKIKENNGVDISFSERLLEDRSKRFWRVK